MARPPRSGPGQPLGGTARPATPGKGKAGARPKVSRIEVKFSEAIEFLRRQLAIGVDEWLEILADEGAISSAIADDTVRSVMADLAMAVLETMDAGGTIADFRKDYARIVADRGWAYKGEDNAAWHSQLIWRLHTNNAFSAGRWEQAQRLEAARPGTIYGRLITVDDERRRPTHAQMHGIIRPIGDRYWLTNWTPNGFNCRCHVQIVSDRDLKRYGWTVTPDSDPRLLVPPDPGWAFNVGIVGARLKQVIRVREGV